MVLIEALSILRSARVNRRENTDAVSFSLSTSIASIVFSRYFSKHLIAMSLKGDSKFSMVLMPFLIWSNEIRLSWIFCKTLALKSDAAALVKVTIKIFSISKGSV